MTKMPELDVPLLRKAVEWVQAEAQKPPRESEWYQGEWRAKGIEVGRTCGTVYCVAGYVAEVTGTEWGWPVGDCLSVVSESGQFASVIAQDALGLSEDEADELFDGDNTAKDVLRIARNICEERGTELGL
jgi:hypothetical protein